MTEEHGISLALPGVVIWLVEGLVTRGRLADAEAALDRFGMNGDLPFHTWFLHLLEKRGALRSRQGRLDEAAADLREAGRRGRAVGNTSVADLFWRSELAPVLMALDRPDEAREVAEEELRLARSFGGRYSIARALIGVAATRDDGDEALAALTEARECARAAATPIVQAQAAVAEGALLRRLSRRSAAREVLREGLDLAERCGATSLAENAQDELAASGARMRRAAQTGPAALTPSERRIARLAADGQSNRAIARSIFVTEKTVETHLTSAYAKLGIGSRRELARALAEHEVG